MENKNFKIGTGKLISVRKIIALAVTGVFCYLSITQKISSTEFIPIFTMIIGYYFGKSTALDIPNNIKENSENDNS
ncbi:MAG: hypothetical protein ACRC68_15250 [Clostridium sp.]